MNCYKLSFRCLRGEFDFCKLQTNTNSRNWSTQSSLRWRNKTGSIGFYIPVPEIQLSARAKVPSLQNSSKQLYQAIAHHAFVSQGRQGITAWFLFTSQICMNFPAKILLVHQVDSSNARVTSLPPRPCFQLGKLQTSTTEEQRGPNDDLKAKNRHNWHLEATKELWKLFCAHLMFQLRD